MVFGPTHKIGNKLNNASKLVIFLWSKIIQTIWICRKLLCQGNNSGCIALYCCVSTVS